MRSPEKTEEIIYAIFMSRSHSDEEPLDQEPESERQSPSSPSNSYSSAETAPAPSITGSPGLASEGDARRPKRCKISREQLNVLIKSFDEEPLPNFDQRQALAKVLGMTPRSVQIWFQNRRQRLKPLQKSQSMNDLPASGSAGGYHRPLSAQSGPPPPLARHYVPQGYGAPFPTDGSLPMPLMGQASHRRGALGSFMGGPLPYDVMEPFAATKALLGAGYNPPASLALAARLSPQQPPTHAPPPPPLHSVPLPAAAASAPPAADGLLMLLACASDSAQPVPAAV